MEDEEENSLKRLFSGETFIFFYFQPFLIFVVLLLALPSLLAFLFFSHGSNELKDYSFGLFLGQCVEKPRV